MPRCKNVPEDHPPVYYSGNENTPRGKGWCAKHEPEGKVRVGKDGKKYCVKGNRWVAHRKSHSKKSPSKRKTSPRLDKEEKLKVKNAIIESMKALCRSDKRLICEQKDYSNAMKFTVEHLKNFLSILNKRRKTDVDKINLGRMLHSYAKEQLDLIKNRKIFLRLLIEYLLESKNFKYKKDDLRRLETMHPLTIHMIAQMVKSNNKSENPEYSSLKQIVDKMKNLYGSKNPEKPVKSNNYFDFEREPEPEEDEEDYDSSEDWE